MLADIGVALVGCMHFDRNVGFGQKLAVDTVEFDPSSYCKNLFVDNKAVHTEQLEAIVVVVVEVVVVDHNCCK